MKTLTEPMSTCKACQGRGYTRPFMGTGNAERRLCGACGGAGWERTKQATEGETKRA